MSIQSLRIFAVVTAVAVIVAWLSISRQHQNITANDKQGKVIFPELQRRIADVVDIVIVHNESRITLSKSNDEWLNMNLGGYPAVKQRVNNMLQAVSGLKYIESKTRLSKLYHKLKVEDSGSESNRLMFKDKSGNVLADIFIGISGKNIDGLNPESVYVRLFDDEQVWLAKGTLNIKPLATQWSDVSVVDIDPASLKTLEVKHADGELVALYRKGENDKKMHVKDSLLSEGDVQQYQIDYLSNILKDVKLIDAKRANGTDFEESTAFELTVETQDSLSITLKFAEPKEEDGSVWARIYAETQNHEGTSDSVKQEADRITSKFNGWVIKLPRKMTDRLKIKRQQIIKNIGL